MLHIIRLMHQDLSTQEIDVHRGETFKGLTIFITALYELDQ